MSGLDKDKPSADKHQDDSEVVEKQRLQELRERLERQSWKNYLKGKYPGPSSDQKQAQQPTSGEFVDKPKSETLYDIKQRIDELSRVYEAMIPGEPRREQLAHEIAELELKFAILVTRRLS